MAYIITLSLNFLGIFLLFTFWHMPLTDKKHKFSFFREKFLKV